MKSGIVTVSVLALPLLLGALTVTPTTARAAAAAGSPTGAELFTTLKCSTCHSIDSQGVVAKIKSEKMKGPDLSDVGNHHDAAWITRWLQHEEKKDGKLHKGKFAGTPEQLQQLATWLAGLKKT